MNGNKVKVGQCFDGIVCMAENPSICEADGCQRAAAQEKMKADQARMFQQPAPPRPELKVFRSTAFRRGSGKAAFQLQGMLNELHPSGAILHSWSVVKVSTSEDEVVLVVIFPQGIPVVQPNAAVANQD